MEPIFVIALIMGTVVSFLFGVYLFVVAGVIYAASVGFSGKIRGRERLAVIILPPIGVFCLYVSYVMFMTGISLN